MIKQIINLLLTILALVFFSPIMLLIALAIYLEDKGKIFFTQERIGLRELPFTIYKFRTMKEGKITKVGSILRKTGLDELPQLFNILNGDMNIVGPRPLTKYDIQRLGWNQYRYMSRWSLKPGLTGLAQIYAGKSAKLSICFDLSYVQTRNFILDFKIILITIFMNLFGKNKIRTYLHEKLKSRKRITDWSKWKKYFSANSKTLIPKIYDSLNGFSEEQKIAFRKSLAIFQIGESGEGRIAKEIDEIAIYGINSNYRECIKFFVKEEGKHGRILSSIIFSLGGKLLESNWTEKLFSLGRRLIGIRLKLLVLLTAETISLIFYQFYINRLPLSGIRAALISILKEEKKHLEFHIDFFKLRIDYLYEKILFKFFWRLITLLAFAVVVLDHYKYLSLFNFKFQEIFMEYKLLISKVEEAILLEERIAKFSKREFSYL